MATEPIAKAGFLDHAIALLWPDTDARVTGVELAGREYRAQVDQLRRVHAPRVYALFILLGSITTLLELMQFPDRRVPSLVAFAAFAAICGATGVLLRHAPARPGQIIAVSNNLLILSLLSYYAIVHGDAAVCALTLLLLMTGFVVLQLSDAGTQAASCIVAILGFPILLQAGAVVHMPPPYTIAAVLGGALVTTAGALLIDRQRAAAAYQRELIRGSEENLRSIFNNMQDIFFRVDRQGIIRMVSPSVARLGYRAEDLVGIDTRVFAGDATERSRINSLLMATTPHGEFELVLPATDGSTIPVSVNARVITEADGQFAGIEGILRDISERKRVEDRLRESEERYRRLYEDNPAMYFTVDASGRVLSVNRFGAEQLGYEPPELTGRPVLDVVFPADREAVQTQLARCLSHLHETVHFEFRKVRHDGTVFWVRETARAVQSGSGEPVMLIVCDDISARKRAEEQAHQHRAELAHVVRVSTMGELAAGLAHEINQPLAAIVNYTRGAQRRLRSGTMEMSTLLDTLEEISVLGLRCGEIIRRMRGFVRKSAPAYEWVDLNDLVRDAGTLTEPDARQRAVRMTYNLSPDLPSVRVDRIQIEQVMLNLMRNALEAMERVDCGEKILTVTTSAAAGGAVEVAISDTGAGMTGEQLEQSFEPFFTTKPTGLGLGLGISRSIVEAHGGRLWATPHAPHGMTFRFVLAPTAEPAAIDRAAG